MAAIRQEGHDDERIPTPPRDTLAEEAVIGSILLEPRTATQVSHLTEEMFTHPAYILAWRAIQACLKEGDIPDNVMVMDQMMTLDPDGYIEWVGLVGQSVNAVPSSGYLEQHASVVLKKYQLRELIHVATTLAAESYRGINPESLGTTTMQRVHRILAHSPTHTTGYKSYEDVLDELQEDIHLRMDNAICGIPTGFEMIDGWLGGMEPGQLIFLAGRPGSGKSAFGLSMSRRIAMHFHETGEGSITVVTMEMSAVSQARRLTAALAGIDTHMMRNGFRDDIDGQAHKNFNAAYARDKATIGRRLGFRQGVINTEALALYAQEDRAQRSMKVLMIDQLDLFANSSKENETARIGQISMALKQLAMREQITVICMVQLNRESVKRTDPRPQISDLRQSGRLEQDADIVLGIYRPCVHFNTGDDPQAYFEWAEIMTLKNRDGPSGMMTPLRFVGKSASYEDWTLAQGDIGDMQKFARMREKGKYKSDND